MEKRLNGRTILKQALAVAALSVFGTACAIDPLGEEIDAVSATEQDLTANVTYTFRNVHANKCLDVTNFSSADGANIQLWECTGQTAQQFTLVSQGGGYFSLRNVNSGKCLDVWGWSSQPGGNIAQYSCTGNANQQFQVQDVGGGAVRFVSRHSGLALDGWNRGTTNGTNVAQWNVNGGTNQSFVATAVGGSNPPPDDECTNVRPTGTEWDSATCDDWAQYTSECSAAWMIDGHLCDESCGRCDSGGGSGGGGNAPERFVGNITTNGQVRSDFIDYWDQITPENEGKWGSVEPTRDSMNWGALDRVYDYAQQHGIPFKQHTMVWGSQQPGWIASLPAAQQAEEVEEWIRLFCQRYPNVAMIDVVNEPPPHTTPSYMNAIGGTGSTGYDWIIWAFQKTRQYCPNATLILNDYNVLRWSTDNFVRIANAVKGSGYVDALGAQAHGLETMSLSELRTNLNKLVGVGLPVYVSEYDVNIASDSEQLRVMQEQFQLFWNTPQIQGITLWGYQHGSTWVPNSGLIRNGQFRPAMTWLMDFLGR